MLRPFTPDDKLVFIALTREFYGSAAVLHDIPDSYHSAAFEEIMRSSEYAQGYIILHDGSIAGYAMTAKTYSHEAGGLVLWLEELYIKEEYRGKGLGHEVFEYLENMPGIARFRLETEPENLRAQALYRSLGYTQLDYLQMYKEKAEEVK